jgi:hypothetical protein
LVQNILGVSVGFQDPWKGLPFIIIGASFHSNPEQQSEMSFSNRYRHAAVLFNKPYLRPRKSAFLAESRVMIRILDGGKK